METFRADIGAANDNRVRRKRNWVLTALIAILLLIGIGYMQTRAYLFHGLPDLPDKTAMWELNLQPNITLLDKDGHIIGHRGPHVGKPYRLEDMPDYVPAAFLAIEDERFYQHTGIDRKAIFRAFFENTKAGRKVQGASTLTQQLVKNMVLTPEKTYRRKFQEMWLSNEMEHVLSKPEILSLYLNRIELGNRAFGVEAAAQRYFGKSISAVNLAEAAMLASLPKAPSRYDPSKNYDLAWGRAQLVLQKMFTNDIITHQELRDAETTPPVIIKDHEEAIKPALIGHVFDMISERAQELIGSDHKDLVIKTTLDPVLQQSAHDTLAKNLTRYSKNKKVNNGAVASIDTRTGAIRALIGGQDYTQSKFNRAVQAKRQPGSAFKAFVYAAALEDGFTPGTVRIDQPTEIAGWAPENYTKRYRGPMTLRESLKLSINTIAAQIGAEIGPEKIARLAKRFGIHTPLRPNYSIALGSSEVNLVELTAAYMVFANEGVKRSPHLIEAIKTTSGTTLYTRRKITPERVYAIPYARQMTTILRDVIETGTGHGAQLGSRQAAGKTGTSQDYRDAWFIGFTAQYTTGVWLGNDDNSPTKKITGGLLPVDVWKGFMVKAHKGLKRLPLNAPDPLTQDDETRTLISFYQNLSDAFISERNIAAGIGEVKNTQSVSRTPSGQNPSSNLSQN